MAKARVIVVWVVAVIIVVIAGSVVFLQYLEVFEKAPPTGTTFEEYIDSLGGAEVTEESFVEFFDINKEEDKPVSEELYLQYLKARSGAELTEDNVVQVLHNDRRCKMLRTCGDIAYVDCGVPADGPGYYVYLHNSAVISQCVRGSGRGCVPAEWTECKEGAQ